VVVVLTSATDLTSAIGSAVAAAAAVATLGLAFWSLRPQLAASTSKATRARRGSDRRSSSSSTTPVGGAGCGIRRASSSSCRA